MGGRGRRRPGCDGRRERAVLRRWRFGFRQEHVGRLEALALEIKLGDGAQDAALEFDQCRIVRTVGGIFVETRQHGAEDIDKTRGGMWHNSASDAG